MTDVYFFGCWNDRIGHYLWVPGVGQYVSIRRERMLPWLIVDGVLCPNIDRAGFAKAEDQIEGLARLHHRDEWTALAWWDRSVDKRHGSNAALFVHRITTVEEVLAEGRRVFPSVMARFNYEIRTK